MATRKTTAKKAQPKGRDVDAPVRHVLWKGERYPMRFDNRCARICEDLYADVFGHPEMGYYDIMNELSVPKHRALMALAYGSIVSAGCDVDYAEFEKDFLITDIEGMREALQQALLESLPQAEDGVKNAEAAPTEEAPTEDADASTPGRG